MLLDWTLKRLLKFILKRTLGRYLKTEVDLDQIDVQLGKGTLQLQNVLLNCDNINQQLALPGWEVRAGYVGSIKASIPVTSSTSPSGSNLAAGTAGGLSSTPPAAAAGAAAQEYADLALNEVYITIAPVAAALNGAGVPSSPGATAAAAAGGMAAAPAADGWEQLTGGLPSDPLQFMQDMGLALGQAGVMEGIKRIAGGLETMLQRLSAVATNITIRVELPAGPAPATAQGHQTAAGGAAGAELVLNISRLCYNDATPTQPAAAAGAGAAAALGQAGSATAAAATAMELVKHLQVQGLTVEVLEWVPEDQSVMGASVLTGDATAGGWPATASGMADLRQSVMLDAASAAAAQQQLVAAAAAAAGNCDVSPRSPHTQGVVIGGSNGTGLGGSLELKLTWLDSAHIVPQIAAELALTPVKLQLQPWQLPLLQLLPAAVVPADGKQTGAVDDRLGYSPGLGVGSSDACARYGMEAVGAATLDDWGRRSFVQDLFFPHCEGFVADSLLYDGAGQRSGYWGAAAATPTGLGAESVYQDARSFMTGIASSMAGGTSSTFFSGVVNSVSSTLGGLAGYAQQGLGYGTTTNAMLGAAAGGPGSSNVPNANRAAAAVQPPDAWSLRVTMPELTAVVWYHDPVMSALPATTAAAQGEPGAVRCSRPEYLIPPRLVLECGGLVATADLCGSAVQADFKAYQLEVSEHLPDSFLPAAAPHSCCSRCGSSCWAAAPAAATPAEYAKVPRHLPTAEQGCRPVPLYGQASAAAAAPAGVSLPGGGGRVAAAGGGVVVWPLLCWGGQPLEMRSVPSINKPCISIQVSGQLANGKPAARCSSGAGSSSRRAPAAGGCSSSSSSKPGGLTKLAVGVDLLPLTLWLSPSAITRLCSILDPLASTPEQQQQQQQGTAGAAVGSRPEAAYAPAPTATAAPAAATAPSSGRVSPSQVEHVIDSILQELHGMAGGGPAAKRVHYTPGVTAPGDNGTHWGAGGGQVSGSSPGGTRARSTAAGGGSCNSMLAQLAQVDLSSTLHLQHVCLVLALPGSSLQSQQQQQQQHRGTPTAQAAQTSCSSTSCSAVPQPGSAQYLVFDFFSGCSTAVNSPATATAASMARSVPLITCCSAAAKTSSSSSGGSNGSSSLLRWPFGSSSQTQTATACAPLTIQVCLTRARAYLVGDPLHLQATGSRAGAAAALLLPPRAGGSSTSGSRRSQAVCILDAAPGMFGRPHPVSPTSSHGHGSSSNSSSSRPAAASAGASMPSATSGFGADDHPPGTAIFAEVSLNPVAAPDATLLADALDAAKGHARNGAAAGSPTYGSGWGMVSELATSPGEPFGVLQFQNRCRQGAAAFCHVRAPRLTSSLARADLLTVLTGLTGWAPPSAAAADPATGQGASAAATLPSGHAVAGASSSSSPQVCVLLQARLRCNLQAPLCNPSAPSSGGSAPGDTAAAPSTGASTATVNAVNVPYDFSAYELTVEDVTALHVSGMSGYSGATASCLSLHGLQLLTGPTRAVALLLPSASRRSTAPVLELLQVQPGPQAPAGAASGGPQRSRWQPAVTGLTGSQPQALPQGVTSVLLQGATLALDEGTIGAQWIAGLVEFFSPPAGTNSRTAGGSPPATSTPAAGPSARPPSTAGAGAASSGSNESNVVVNIRDMGVRYEPSSTGIQTHNSSRIAAALVVDGAHWALNQGPAAGQHIALSSLSFYVAPAAGRMGGGTLGWSPGAPRDLPGLNLLDHGYHCLLQEGGLKVLLQPERGCIRHGGSHTTWEVVVTNQHLVGALHQDSAVLLLQLVNQLRADLLLQQQQAGSQANKRTAAAGAAAQPKAAAGAAGVPAATAAAMAAPMGVTAASRPAAVPPPFSSSPVALAAAGGSHNSSSSSSRAEGGGGLLLHLVQEDAFRMAPPAAACGGESPPGVAASIFLNGGWYPAIPGVDIPRVKSTPQGQVPGSSSSFTPAAGLGTPPAAATAAAAGRDSATGPDTPPAATAVAGSRMGNQASQPRYPSVPAPDCGAVLWQQAAAAADTPTARDPAGAPGAPLSGLLPEELCSSVLPCSGVLEEEEQEDLARSILPFLGVQEGVAGLPVELEVPTMVPVLLEDFYPQQVLAEGVGPPVDAPTSGSTPVAQGALSVNHSSSSSSAGGGGAGGTGGWQLVERSGVSYSKGLNNQLQPSGSSRGNSISSSSSSTGRNGVTGPVLHPNHVSAHGVMDFNAAEDAAAAAVAVAAADCPKQGRWFDLAASASREGSAGYSQGAGGDSRPHAQHSTQHSIQHSTAADRTALLLQEDYVAQPPQLEQGSEEGLCFGGGASQGGAAYGGDLGWTDTLGGSNSSSHRLLQHMCPCDGSVPCAVSRVVLKGISCMWVLHGSASGAGAAGRNTVNGSSKGRSKPSRSAKGGATEGRVEVEVDGLDISIVQFPQGSHYLSRCGVVVGSVEARDCGATAAGGGGSKWVKILSVRRPGQPGSHVAGGAAAAAAEAPVSPGGVTAVTNGELRVPSSGAGLADLVCSHIPESLRCSASGAASSLSSGSGSSHLHHGAAGGAPSSTPATARSSTAAGPAAAAAAAPGAASSSRLLPPGWPAAVAAPGHPLPAVALVLDTVCSDPATAPEVEEYRLTAALLPVRLKLDQDVVAFLAAFSTAVSQAMDAVDNPMAAALAATGAEPPAPPYFQRAEVWGTGVMLDYRPRRVNVAALREGDFLELLNLVPWGGVDLSLKPLKLIGVEGWDGVGVAAAMEWLQHAARTQAHKFLTGVAPIRSVVRVGGAVAGLLAVPAAQISGAVARRGGSLAAVAASAGGSSASDALRKSTVSFVRALVFEALGLGATVAAGAQVVLAGGLPVEAMEAPSGFVEGLKAAAGELRGGLGAAADVLVRGPMRGVREGTYSWQQAARRALRAAPAAAGTSAQAAAAAMRYTLLGLQCAMDPDKRLEQ